MELAGVEGTGPGGRIVKADVEAAAATATTRRRRPSAPRRRPRRTKPARRGEDSGEAEQPEEKPTTCPRRSCRATPAPAAARRRTEDLTRLQQTVARRMAESKATAPEFVMTCEVDMEAAVEFRAQLKAAAGERAGALVQRLRGQGVRARAARVPARERRLPRRQVRALLARQRRHRRGRPGRAGRADDLRRRPQVARRDRPRRARAGRARARRRRSRRPSCPSGTFTRLQPRHVRDQALRRGHQPAAGGDPRRRRDDAAAGRARRRDRGRARSWSSRSRCDHRILYGADAAQFLGRIRERLENPLSLAL